ncbi:hypothetical protein SASPL_125891 [Salvia splendens]|uniref:HMA domain-containing protein n=1 Tax=Salvia splendens TaxID=180675 RepID=A0A8X8XG92_SALSN|nr:hypothetical protein SASPL_125891 [Salvia splendens]
MGEEEKKPEEPKPAPEEPPKPAVDAPKEQPPPPPPQEIVLKVYMHLEDVMTDCRTSKVVVKGEKADPVKVLERVQRKSHRQVELISPIPPPPAPEEAKKPEEKEPPKPELMKEEPPVITVVLGVYMHCEACAQELKKRILRMKGVESVEPDMKSSQVTVKGVLDAEKLTDYVHKRTGKHATVQQAPQQRYMQEYQLEYPPPQMFSDENPNAACSVM